MKSERNVAFLAGILGFLGVALGAFGAHALRGVLSAQAQEWWHTAVLYHLIHAVALLIVSRGWSGRWSAMASVGFAGGIIAFSGSLYLMALTGQTGWGLVTPVGGLLFLGGWVAVTVGFRRG